MSPPPEPYRPAPKPTSTPTTPASSLLKFDSSKIPSFSRTETIWLIVIGVLFLALIVLLSWLLLRYTCTRAGRQQGRQILDQRQEFQQRHIPRPMGDIEAQEHQQGPQEYRNATRDVDIHEEKQPSERPRSVWWPLPPWGLASPDKVVVRRESGPSVCEGPGVRRQGVVFV